MARTASRPKRRPAQRHTADPNPPHITRLVPKGETAAEKQAWGRALRTSVPRSAHGEFTLAPDRPDPVALLEEQGAERVQDLVPIRYGRMLASPFAFLRGSALVMTADLARLPSSGLFVQACGDAHLSNFGIFKSPERRLIFDLNDFDETYPAPFEWDVKRLAASAMVAARSNGFSEADSRATARTVGRAYRQKMVELSALPFMDVWYQRFDVEAWFRQVKRTGRAPRAAALIQRAETRNHLGALAKFAEPVNGKWQIRPAPPLVVRLPRGRGTRQILRNALRDYVASLPKELTPITRHYHFVDAARKVVGVGSVGTEAFMALFLGDRDFDPIFLQFKEAGHSVLERYTVPKIHTHQGERVVYGQRLMQAASDPFLGWFRGTGPRGLDFYVRQLLDGKVSVEVETLNQGPLKGYVSACAETLARAHARSGHSSAIAGYLGTGDTFDKAIEAFAVKYADQTLADHAALVDAEASGRITARRDV